MTLFHSMSLAFVMVLNVKASKTNQGRMAFHVVLVDLGPQLHLPVPARCAGLAEEGQLTCPAGQSGSAAKPAVVGAINAVELIEGAVPTVTAHLTAGLALAVNITVAICPQPVSPQTMALWHSSVVVLRQERREALAKCVMRFLVHEHANRVCLPTANWAESRHSGRIHLVPMIQVQAAHCHHPCCNQHWPIGSDGCRNLSV
jgi:hypothetical protein